MRSFRSALALFAVLVATAACGQPTAPTGEGTDALAGLDADVATGGDGESVDAVAADTVQNDAAQNDLAQNDTEQTDAAQTDAAENDAAPADADAADVPVNLDSADGDAADVDAEDDAGSAADAQPDSKLECTQDGDCADADPCTLDTCAANVCTHTPQDGPCDDGNPCTGGDTCTQGTCSGAKIACPGTVCGNGVLEAGEDCDFGGVASVCCDATTCTTLPSNPTETEPNNTKVGIDFLKDDITGGSTVASESCGTIDGQFQPDQMVDNWDVDFFKFYVPAPSTVYLDIVDPTGGDGCVWQGKAGSGWASLDTQLAAFDSALVQVATNDDKVKGNACSAVVIDAATPGWYYAGTVGYGSDAQNNDVNQPYRLLTKMQPWKCGDGLKQGSEACDGTQFGPATCVTLGYTGGTLACASDCGLNTGACTGTPPGAEPNDAFTTATPMVSLIAGHLGGGVDYYKLDLPAGAVLTATTSDPTGGNACATSTAFPPLADLNTQLALYGPDQQQLVGNDDIHSEYPPFDATANFCSSVTWSVATAGTYYLAVTGSGLLTVTDPVTGVAGYPVGYALNVTVTPWTCEPAPDLPCELPDNHTPATAMPIDGGAAGVVSSPAQADYFVFQVDTDGTMIAATIRDGGVPAVAGQPTCAAGQIDTQLAILAADATTVLTENDNISAVNLCSAVTLTLAAGTYYAVVSSQNPSQAMPYALHIGRGIAKWVTAAAGGTVQMPAGLDGAGTSVTIPPGALDDDTLITMVGGEPIAFAEGTLLGTPIALGPSGTTFGAPVTVSLTGLAPTTDARLVLHRHDATGEVELLIADANTAPDVATVTLDSFSTVQAAATAQPMIAWNKHIFQETYANYGTIGEIIGRCVNCQINTLGTKNATLDSYLGSIDALGMGIGTCAINSPVIATTHAQIYNINTIGWTLITTEFDIGSASNTGPFSCQFTDAWHDTPTTSVPPFATLGGVPLPTSQILQAKSTFSLAFYDTPTLTTNNNATFQHAIAADGTVPGVVTLTLSGGEQFKAAPGTVLSPTIPSNGDVARFTGDWSLGLTPQLKVTGPTTAQVTFTGMQAPPIPHAGIVDFLVLFIPGDFKHFPWPSETAVPLHLDWHARELHVSRYFYNENATLNDGTITTTGTFTLEGDTFTAAVGTHIGTFTGVPAGLVPDLVVTGPTTAKLSFSGKATDPVDGDWNDNLQNGAVVHDVSVKFADADFTAGQAALLTGANRDDLHIVMYRFPGFVYTGLADGGNIALEAYDFGAGPRYLYWQPILREGGLVMNYAQTEQCAEPNLGCQLKNFGVEDRLAFAAEGGANPHKVMESGKPSGCKKPGAAADALAYCGMDQWYPFHIETQLRVVGAGQAVIHDSFLGAVEQSPDGKPPAPNPALGGTLELNPDPSQPPIQTCPFDKVCCGHDSPYWEQHDVGWGTTGYAGTYPKWPADPIDFNAGWTALASWGWDFGSHPLVGGPTDKFVFDWYSGKGVWVTVRQELQCPDVRLVNGKRVDLCDGAGYQYPGTYHSELRLFGFPVSWTTKCTGQWSTPGAVCEALYDSSSTYGGCYGQVTENPTGNYPRFY